MHCKLTFKKKLFRESDEAISEPMFVQLSYVQVCNIGYSNIDKFNLCSTMISHAHLNHGLNLFSGFGDTDFFSQLQHDYVLGNYPVGRDDAAQLSALQILVEIGFVGSPESCKLVDLLFYFILFFPSYLAANFASKAWQSLSFCF